LHAWQLLLFEYFERAGFVQDNATTMYGIDSFRRLENINLLLHTMELANVTKDFCKKFFPEGNVLFS